jgi:hypothetical protein
VTGSKAGENWAGYTKQEHVPSEEGKQVDKSLQHVWPPGTDFGAATKRPPGARQQKKRSLIEPAPGRNGKRPKRRTVPQPSTPKPYKRPKSTPGAQAVPKRKGGK